MVEVGRAPPMHALASAAVPIRAVVVLGHAALASVAGLTVASVEQ
jgi:hypothetical protein